MKHIELIELLYKHREIIDKAFLGEKVESLPRELIDDAAIFQKVAKEYELGDSYIQFANAMLKRVDANYTFGDYSEEIKLLAKQKSDYLETKEKRILYRIKELARTLYKKIEQRDILINARINDILHDNDLSIELIIKDATDVDNRISDLIQAHTQNLKILGSELRGLDDELDTMLIDIMLDLLPFAENIHIYNKRLSDFILKTEKRKEQNKKLASLSNKIIKEQDNRLEALLLSNTRSYHHTLKERKTTSIKYLASLSELHKSSFIDALSKVLLIHKVERKSTHTKPYLASQSIELKAINLEKIQNDIKEMKPEDLYRFILGHHEIKKFAEDGLEEIYAFKTYLTIVQNNRERIVLQKDFNQTNIRVARWT